MCNYSLERYWHILVSPLRSSNILLLGLASLDICTHFMGFLKNMFFFYIYAFKLVDLHNYIILSLSYSCIQTLTISVGLRF